MRPDATQKKMITDRPGLYLIYLVFLFLPWLFYTPGSIDAAVTIAAAVIYLPLHFACFKAEDSYKLWLIGATAALGISVAPFINGYSVFHIYAAAATGYVRPVRLSGAILGLCTLVYVASGFFFDRYIPEIVMGLVISIVVWISTFSDAEANAAHEQAERERTLETQQASLVERERIARDLHDLLGHTLTLVALKADLARRLIDADPDRAKAEIESIQSSSREALSDVRKALSGLTSTNVKEELKNAEIALKVAQIELRVTGQYPKLSADQDTAIGLIIREAVTNVVRHSSANLVTVTFDDQESVIGVTVSDNGSSQGIIMEGNGLSGLRRRLEVLGGALSIRETGGIQVRATLPA